MLLLQEEVLARSQSKQFYQHLIMLFQHLKTRLVTSRPCFLLPRAGINSNTSSYSSAAGGLLAVSCALDDDLVYADDACLTQQTLALPDSAGPQGRNSEGGNGNAPPGGRLGSYNIFGNNQGANGSKPGLGVFIAGGSGSSGVPIASQGPALVVAAGPHQVLLPPESTEGEAEKICSTPRWQAAHRSVVTHVLLLDCMQTAAILCQGHGVTCGLPHFT
jgi:hypothetical protein